MQLCRQAQTGNTRQTGDRTAPRLVSGAKALGERPRSVLFCSVLFWPDAVTQDIIISLHPHPISAPHSCLTRAAPFTGRRLVVLLALATLFSPFPCYSLVTLPASGWRGIGPDAKKWMNGVGCEVSQSVSCQAVLEGRGAEAERKGEGHGGVSGG